MFVYQKQILHPVVKDGFRREMNAQKVRLKLRDKKNEIYKKKRKNKKSIKNLVSYLML